MSSESKDPNEWLDGFSQQQMQIWCEDPETNVEKIAGGVMGIGKSYVTYRILMKQVGRDIVGVRHRYSEFETLRNSLRDRYGPLGIAVPALPPKTSVSNIISANLKQTFIKERILGLTIFCELIVSSPWLRNDKLWKEFMKPKTGGPNSSSDTPSTVSSFASAFKSSNTVPVAVYDNDNVGENKLFACLALLEVPYKFTLTQRMEEVRIEVAAIEKFVKVALDKVRTVQTCERAYASAQEGLVDALGQWVAAEQAGVRTMAGRTFDENKNVLQFPHEYAMQSASSATSLLKLKCGLFQNFPDYTGLSLASMLEQELSLVESIKELLRMHDEMVSGIDAITAKIVKTEASRSANKFEQAAEQRIILEERQASLTAFYKGFIYFTLPCSARQRSASLRRLTSQVAACELTSSYALQIACIAFFTEISVKPSAAITEACRMFELLKVKQLEQIPVDITAGFSSPALSPSATALNLADSASSLSISDTSSIYQRGSVLLSPDSAGVSGLFARAQAIGQQGKTPADVAVRRIIGAAPASPIAPSRQSSEGQSGNPLARRGSAVAKPQHAHGADGSSLMAEVPDEMLSAEDTRPSYAVTAPPQSGGNALASSAETFSSGRLSPLKPSEKSQSLMADLMGGGGVTSDSNSGKKSPSVWEDV